MPKVKLTESELRKVVATIIREQDPDVKRDVERLESEIALPTGASDQLDLEVIIRQDALCSELSDLASKLSGPGLIQDYPTQAAYRYGRFTEKILQELQIDAHAVTWNNNDPLASLRAARQYMKLSVLSSALRKEFTLDADELNGVFSIGFSDAIAPQLLYIIDPTNATTAFWPGTFAPGDAADNLECLKIILGKSVTTIQTISSAVFWTKLDDAAWVKSVNAGLTENTLLASNPDGVVYCDHPSVKSERENALVKTFSAAASEFRRTYNAINTSAFDTFFVTPLMYPSIWKVTKQEGSPLYDPWSTTLSVCNMINNAIALPGGLAALAIKLTEASTTGIAPKGLSASIEGFDPRESDQYITLNESRKIMVTLPELRRIVQAAFSIVITESKQKSLRKNFNKTSLNEGKFLTWASSKGLAIGGAAVDLTTDARKAFTAGADVAVDAVNAWSDPNVTKHADDLLKIIESLVPNSAASIVTKLDSVVVSSYDAIFNVLKPKYFDNTLFTPKPGRTLASVLGSPCVIDLSKYGRYAQLDANALERVRLALNNAAAINVAQRANRGTDAAEHAERLRAVLQTDAQTAETIKQIFADIAPPGVDQAVSKIFEGNSNLLDSAVSGTSIGDVKIIAGVDPQKWSSATATFLQDQFVKSLAGKLFTVNPSKGPDEFVMLDTATARFLGNKQSLNTITIEEINQSTLPPALKKTIIGVKNLLDQAVSSSENVIDGTERVVAESRKAILKDAAEGASQGALSIARGFLENGPKALRAVVAGPQAKEANSLMKIVDSLGQIKYDPDAASDIFDMAPVIDAAQAASVYANALGRILFFLDKGLPRATQQALEASAKNVKTPVVGSLARVGSALLQYSYSANVTRVIEKLEQVTKMPAWLSKTNWTKMWIAKSVTTAGVTILLQSQGWVGPSWEAEHPYWSGFTNLLKTLNNPNVFSLGLIDLMYDLTRGIVGEDDKFFTDEQLKALLNPEIPNLIISALNNLAVGAEPDPGLFPDNLLASKPVGAEDDVGKAVVSALGTTLSAVGSVIRTVMNLGTDVGRSNAEAAKASLADVERQLGTAIAVLDEKSKSARKLGGLDAGNQAYKNLETLRLGIISKLIDKIKRASYTPFSTLGYTALNVPLKKEVTATSARDFWYLIRNTDEMVGLSFMVAGEGPIKPISSGVSLPVSNLDSVIAQLKEAGVVVPDLDSGETGEVDTARDVETSDAGQVPRPVSADVQAQMAELSARFEQISGKWQDLLVKMEVDKQGTAAPAAPAAP